MPRLGILGTFVWDTVWTVADQAAGKALETWGGMAYSLAPAAAARPEGWEIVPIAHVGEDLVEQAHAFLDTIEGIGPRDAVVAVAHPNNRVELVYHDDARRGEKMSGGVPGWSWDELAPHVEGLDALCINFFSGWELSLEAAESLAKSFPGSIYADLHSLFLGPPRADGPRLPRVLPDANRWLGCFDVVQLNREERALLLGMDLARKPAGELLEHGPDAALVTLGADGASYAAADPRGLRRGLRGPRRLRLDGRGHVPPDERLSGGDPTGAGDAWGAAACCGILAGLPLETAVRRANALAAVKMQHRGGDGLYQHLVAHREAWEVAG